MKSVRSFLFTLVCVALWVGVADACPTCKESVAENGGNLIRGYFWSIVFMMSMPFLIFGGLSTMFYLDVRRARQRQAMAADVLPAEALSVGSA